RPTGGTPPPCGPPPGPARASPTPGSPPSRGSAGCKNSTCSARARPRPASRSCAGPCRARRSCSANGGAAVSAANLDLALDYLPRLPRRKDFRIGCVGAGFIMADCHLVAYRQAGFNPVAIASRDPARARAAAERHGIPRCHATYAEVLADPEVEVLDVAVPPDAQPAVIRQAVEHKDYIRGILAQKPLAMSVREAKECVDLC